MFFSFWCFGKSRWSSTRSSNKFLDKQSETCPKSFNSNEKNPRNYNICESQISHISRTNIHDSLSFYVIFSCFSDLGVLARAEGALRDPRKIFSTSNLRLVKQVAARRKKHLRTTIYENHRSRAFHDKYSWFVVILCDIFMFFRFGCFSKGRRRSARS